MEATNDEIKGRENTRRASRQEKRPSRASNRKKGRAVSCRPEDRQSAPQADLDTSQLPETTSAPSQSPDADKTRTAAPCLLTKGRLKTGCPHPAEGRPKVTHRNERSQTRMWSSSGHKNQASGGSGGVVVEEEQRASACPHTTRRDVYGRWGMGELCQPRFHSRVVQLPRGPRSVEPVQTPASDQLRNQIQVLHHNCRSSARTESAYAKTPWPEVVL